MLLFAVSNPACAGAGWWLANLSPAARPKQVLCTVPSLLLAAFYVPSKSGPCSLIPVPLQEPLNRGCWCCDPTPCSHDGEGAMGHDNHCATSEPHLRSDCYCDRRPTSQWPLKSSWIVGDSTLPSACGSSSVHKSATYASNKGRRTAPAP